MSKPGHIGLPIGPAQSARRLVIGLTVLCMVAIAVPAQAEPLPADVAWDRPANIRDAAARIGTLQRTRGTEAAIRHIDACYRTHSLAETYSAPFEACIAQDYLVTKMLVQVYGRLAPDERDKLGSPSPAQLAHAMGQRIVAAFSQYQVSVASAEAFKTEVDRHGLPVYLKIVLPQARDEIEALERDRATNSKQK